MPKSPRVLLVNADAARTAAVRTRVESSGLETIVRTVDQLAELPPADVAVMVLAPDTDSGAISALEDVVASLAKNNVASLVWGPHASMQHPTAPLLNCLTSDISLDEVVGRLSAIAHYAPMLKGMDRELRHLQTLGQQLNRYFNEIDQEMQLAGRLQRDFLPTKLPSVGSFSTYAMYRPASWVSGDTYDISHIDDTTVSLFLGDAMGHGVAAGLITMFMQQRLSSRELRDDHRQINCPPAVLALMHESLVRQQLPSCQFVTAVFAVLESDKQTIRVSRAGHPYPILIAADGTMREVEGEGGLLGIPDLEPEFDEVAVALKPGEKFVVYTDGLEDVLLNPDGENDDRFHPRFREWGALSAEELMVALQDHLDNREGSLNPSDDATFLIIENSGIRPNTMLPS